MGNFDFEAARKAGYSDAEISDYVAPSLKFDVAGARSAGYDDKAIAAHLQERVQSSDFVHGVKTTFQQLPQLGYGLAAITAAAIETAAGEGGLASSAKNWAVGKYKEWGDKIQSEAKETDEFDVAFERAKEGDYGALVDFLQYGVGYAVGQGLQIITGAGAGAVLGKAALKGSVEKLAGGMVAKEAERLIATGVTKDVAEKQAVASIARQAGALGATGAYAFGMEGGEIGGGLAERSVEEGRVLTGTELARAGGATVLAGLYEFAGDALGLGAMLGKIPVGKALAGTTGVKGRAARGLVAGTMVAPAEAGTEYLQTGVEEWGKGAEANLLPFNQSPEAQRQAINAAALGWLGGQVMGGVGGALTSPTAPEKPAVDPVQRIAGVLQAPTVEAALNEAEAVYESDVSSSILSGLIGQELGRADLRSAEQIAEEAKYGPMIEQRDANIAAATARADMARARLADTEQTAEIRARLNQKLEGEASELATQLEAHDAKGETGAIAQAYRAALVKKIEDLGFEAPAATSAGIVGTAMQQPGVPRGTTAIDLEAQEAAVSDLNQKPQPTTAQILAGNAELGHPRLPGLELSIQSPAGSIREDKQNVPPKWRQEMKGVHYGYARGTVGFDKDHLDVVLKEGTPEDWKGTVYVVNQNKAGGQFDEHKAVAGAATAGEARQLYLSMYEPGWESRIRSIVPIPYTMFRAWAQDKSMKGPKGGELKPLGGVQPVAATEAEDIFAEAAAEVKAEQPAGAEPTGEEGEGRELKQAIPEKDGRIPIGREYRYEPKDLIGAAKRGIEAGKKVLAEIVANKDLSQERLDQLTKEYNRITSLLWEIQYLAYWNTGEGSTEDRNRIAREVEKGAGGNLRDSHGLLGEQPESVKGKPNDSGVYEPTQKLKMPVTKSDKGLRAEIDLVELKNGLWLYATDFWAGQGGASGPSSISGGTVTTTKKEAIKRGADNLRRHARVPPEASRPTEKELREKAKIRAWLDSIVGPEKGPEGETEGAEPEAKGPGPSSLAFEVTRQLQENKHNFDAPAVKEALEELGRAVNPPGSTASDLRAGTAYWEKEAKAGTANWAAIEREAEENLKETGGEQVIPEPIASGMNRDRDMKAAIASAAGVGVAIQEVSGPGMAQLAAAVAAGKTVFVDSGAFTAFKKGGTVDFERVFNRYYALSAAVKKAAKAAAADAEKIGETYIDPSGLLMLVAPDVVGSQEKTLALLEKYQERLQHLADQGHEVIIPFQRGPMAQTDAYDKVVEIMGGESFVVGIPTQAAALTDQEARNLLERLPDRIHILGGVAESKIAARMALIRELYEDDVPGVTADAMVLKSKLSEVKGLEGEEKFDRIVEILNRVVPEGTPEPGTSVVDQVADVEIKSGAHQWGGRTIKSLDDLTEGDKESLNHFVAEIRRTVKGYGELSVRGAGAGLNQSIEIRDQDYNLVYSFPIIENGLMKWAPGYDLTKALGEYRAKHPGGVPSEPRSRQDQLDSERQFAKFKLEAFEKEARSVGATSLADRIAVLIHDVTRDGTRVTPSWVRDRVLARAQSLLLEAKANPDKKWSFELLPPSKGLTPRQKADLAKAAERKAKNEANAEREAERDLYRTMTTDATLVATAQDNEATRINLKDVLGKVVGKLINQTVKDDPARARALEAAYKRLADDAEFITSVQKALVRERKRVELEAARNPAHYSAALQAAETKDNIGDDPLMRTAYKGGWDHALTGKTRSTLTGDLLNVITHGYDAGRNWIKTEIGRAWFTGKREEKLTNTGVDLRRWFDKAKAELEALKGDAGKAWKEVDRLTTRGELFKDLLPEAASPGARRYLDQIRRETPTFLEWVFSNGPLQRTVERYGEGLSDRMDSFIKGTFRYPDAEAKYGTDEKRRDALKAAADEYLALVEPLIEALRGKESVAGLETALRSIFGTGNRVGSGWEGMTEEGVQLDKARVAWRGLLNEWAIKQLKAGEATGSDTNRSKALVPPRLDRIERTEREDYRKGENVTPAQVKEKFGFADIGFGNWVAAKEDQDHLNYAYDAFMDLATELGIDPKGIGLGGTLHLTIGALGHGKHAAHYSPNHPGPNGTTVRVINLTNTKGDGTVAHEWHHALDYHLGEGSAATDGKLGWFTKGLKVGYDKTALELTAKRFLIDGWYYRRSKDDKIGNARRAVQGQSDSGPTNYYKEAKLLGEDYWANNRELFARASEAWLYDKMGRRQSNYLVNPWVADGVTGKPAYRGSPYPVGAERQVFGRYFEALYKSLDWNDTGPVFNVEKWEKAKPTEKEEFDKARALTANNIENLHADLLAEQDLKKQNREAKVAAEQRERDRLAKEEQLRKEAAAAAAVPSTPIGPMNEDELHLAFDQAASELRESTQEEPDAATPGSPTIDVAAPTAEQDFGAQWDAMGYGPRQDLATPLYPNQRAVVHRISGSKWDALSEGEQKSMRLAAENAEKLKNLTSGRGGVIETDAEKVKRTAGDIAAEAAKLGVEGIGEAMEGLVKLFGGNKLKSFPAGFSEEDYKAAKPHFQAALEKFQAAGKTLKEFFKFLIQQFGESVKPYALRFAKDLELSATLQGPSNPSFRVARWVQARLQAGSKITTKDLYGEADEAFAGTQAEGKYTPKDAYDSVEAGVNLYLRDGGWSASARDLDTARRDVANLERMTGDLPTQTRRTEEMDEFQQFSTPPAYAYAVNWAANVRTGDLALEPSAGTGSLAIFAENSGARLILNELSKRRAGLLQSIFPNARHFTEDAAQIDNLLPADLQPTVVVMNPPFSATAGRVEGKRDTMEGARHISQALLRLAHGGRLVAIVGEGMAMDKPAFRDWWAQLKAVYNVRANIGIEGKGYAKYGTTFDNQILVIDKDGPTVGAVVTGKVATVSEALPLLEGIRNDRAGADGTTSSAAENAEPATTQPGSGETAAGGVDGGLGPTRPGAAPVVPAGGGIGGQLPAGAQGSGGQAAGAGTGTTPGGAGVPDNQRPGGSNARPTGVGRPRSGRGGAAAGTGGSGQDAGTSAVAAEATIEQAEGDSGEFSEGVYEQYQPQRLTVPGAQPHPGGLVQSSAMASVLPPKPTYTPNLTKAMIEKGLLSLPQIEAVVYAGQAHSEFLPNGSRRGFMIGDGTGVGKGREIAGIILDNQRQGRKKAVWISEKGGLEADARRDMEGAGGDPAQIISLKNAAQGLGTKVKYENKPGVLFTTYATMRKEDTKPLTPAEAAAGIKRIHRIDQIVDWVGGEDFDGVLVFDESHALGNALPIKGERGVKEVADQALKGIALQRRLPKARVVYVSATAATEVANLTYAERLGLWGEGTAFAGVQDFVTAISAAGVSAMELVAQGMKAIGAYMARSLSYDGVKYDRVTHELTEIQRDSYNEMVRAWQVVLQNVNAAMATTGQAQNGHAKGNAMAQFWGSHQRFFNQLITAMQMPTIIESVRKDLDAGHAIVLQLVNTNEAPMERQYAKAKARREESGEDNTEEDFEFGPMDGLIDYVTKSFPINQYEPVAGPNNTVVWQPVLDSKGNPVVSREAVKMRDDLIANLKQIAKSNAIPGNPIDTIIEAFGHQNVGEVTGRKRRLIKERTATGDGYKTVEQKVSDSTTKADAVMFLADKKKVLVISDKGGTGFSFHADNTKKNRRLRRHYLVQPGWRADKVLQGFGRTHRTNQKQPPEYILTTTDLKAQKRFISSIARRLDQLGALTKGERKTASGGLFTAADNLESTYAKTALRQVIVDLHAGRIPGMDFADLMHQMGLDLIDPKTQGLSEKKLPRMPQFLNRLLSLRIDSQSALFDQFAERMDELVQAALDAGTYDDGMQTLKALKIEKASEDEVYEDKRTGATTRYVDLALTQPTVLNDWASVVQMADVAGPEFSGYYLDNRSKGVFAAVRRGRRIDADGKEVMKGMRVDVAGRRRFIDNVMQIEKPRHMQVPIVEKTTGKVYRGDSWRVEVKEDNGASVMHPTSTLIDAFNKFSLEDTKLWLEQKRNDRGNAWTDAMLTALERLQREAVDGEKELRQPHYAKLTPAEAKAEWARQYEAAPKTYVEHVHMISGLLLPVWDRFVPGPTQVARAATTTGERFLGRLVPPQDLSVTLRNFGVNAAKNLTTEQIVQALQAGDTAVLANSWRLQKARVAGEWRIELTGNLTGADERLLREIGLFTERIQWKTRWFVPAGDAGTPVLARLLASKPVVELVGKGGPAGAFSRQSENIDAFKFTQGPDKNGRPAFANNEIILAHAKGPFSPTSNTFEWRVLLRRSPGENGQRFLHVGYLTADLTDDGKFSMLKNIGIYKRFRQAGKGYGESVVASMLATNGPGYRMGVENILHHTGDPEFDAINFWRKIGVRLHNYSTDPNVEIHGDLGLTDYLRARGEKGRLSRYVTDQGLAGEAGEAQLTAGQARTGEIPAPAQEGPAAGRRREGLSGRSRRAPETVGLGLEAVRALAEGLAARWANAPRIHVIASITEAPPAIQRQDAAARSQGATGAPEAFLYQGEVWLNAEALGSPYAVYRAVFHEALGHFGLRGVFGAELAGILDEVADSMPGRVQAKAEAYGIDFTTPEGRREAAEEVLAELAQSRPELGLVRRAIAVIRQFLRDLGLDVQLSDADVIANFILPARSFVERGAAANLQPGTAPFERQAPIWYSGLQRQIEAVGMNAAPVKGWKDYLKGQIAKGGVKADEIQWSGLEEWLDLQAGRVTKEQVLEFVKANGVRLTETLLGEAPAVNKQEFEEQKTEALNDLSAKYNEWIATQNFNFEVGSADEHLGDRRMTEVQRHWISYFLDEWNSAQYGTSLRDIYKVRLDALGFDIEEDPAEPNIIVTLTSRQTGNVYAIEGEPDRASGERRIGELPEEAFNIVTRLGELPVDEDGVPEGETRYRSYTEPGGANYRELLLQLPGKTQPGIKGTVQFRNEGDLDDFLTDLSANGFENLDYGAVDFAGNRTMVEFNGLAPEAAQAFQDTARGHMGKVSKASAAPWPLFLSSHFIEPNILAHIRFNERTDAEGKRVLFVEEIQSDWAQHGKREGFGQKTVYVLSDRNGRRQTTVRTIEEADAVISRQPSWTVSAETEVRHGVAAAPFVTKTDAWVGLALKRVIRYAAENGSDRVAWTTGEQQADRYSLQSQVNNIDWAPATGVLGTTGKNVAVMLKGGGLLAMAINVEGIVTSTNGFRGSERTVGQTLADVIGKTAADKIQATPRGTLEGEGLKIGGEGMIEFYDTILPKVAKDVLKKLGGGKVGEITIAGIKSKKGWKVVDRNGEELQGGFDSHASAQRFMDAEVGAAGARIEPAEGAGQSKQASFEITPALREKAMAGMPMFHRVYHGSPHRFDRFDTSKIGSGEGVQAYGWGLYFADRRGVARHYRDTLSGQSREYIKWKWDLRSAEWLVESEEHRVAFWPSAEGQKMIVDEESRRKYGLKPYSEAEIADQTQRLIAKAEIDLVEARKKLAVVQEQRPANRRGGLYQVELSPKDGDYLLWDVPFSQQPEGVQKALKESFFPERKQSPLTRWFWKIMGLERAGWGIYGALSKRFGGAEAASRALLGAGIPGIKYLDNTGRRRGRGSYNYVVFSDEHATITGRFSRSPAIAGGPVVGGPADSFASSASSFIKDMLHSDAKMGWWKRTVGTQQHKALTNAAFAGVFNEVQAFIGDVSKFANEAADAAADLLPRIENYRDFAKKTPNEADVDQVTQAVYAGTLYGGGNPLEGRRWTREELLSGRVRDGAITMRAFRPLTERQADLYDQVIESMGVSLEALGKSIIAKLARQHKIGFDRETPIDTVAASVRDQADEKIDTASVRIAALNDELTQVEADAATASEQARARGATWRTASEEAATLNRRARQLEAEIATLEETVTELRTLKTQVTEVEAKTLGLKDRGYFPAMRFGRYAIQVLEPDANGEPRQVYFSLFESQLEANRAARELAREFPRGELVRGTISQEQFRLFGGLGLDVLEAFADYITDESGQPIAKDPLVQGFIKAAVSERSNLKRHLHRKGVAGFSRDLSRVLAAFTVSTARATSSNYHGAEMDRLALAIKEGDVKDEAVKLVRYIKDPEEEAHFTRALLFVQFLGGSIAHGLVNMTQPYLVSIPYLSQHTTAADAAAKIGDASTTKEGDLTGQLATDFARAKREGVVAPQEIHQLRAEAGGLPVGRSLLTRKLSFLWGSIYSITEQFNRKTTFIAAYRVAEEKGLADPYAFATNAVNETQFIYNKGNRPNWARGAIGATVFTFKQFSISYLELAQRLYKHDKRAFALLVLMLLVAAGLEGLPFAEDIEDLIDTLGQWMGYATNSKKKLRSWATGLLGETLGQIALHGISGLPFMPVDVSVRMGLQNLVPGTAMLKPSEKNKARDVLEIVGPVGQLVPAEGTMAGRALERLSKGDVGGAVAAGAPVAIQNILKGAGMLDRGYAVDALGKRITDVSGAEAALKIFGLNPATVARESEKMRAVHQDIALQKRIEDEIVEKWARGIVDKDPAVARDAMMQLNRWNTDNPELRVRITMSQVRERARAMTSTRVQRVERAAPREIRGSVREQLR